MSYRRHHLFKFFPQWKFRQQPSSQLLLLLGCLMLLLLEICCRCSRASCCCGCLLLLLQLLPEHAAAARAYCCCIMQCMHAADTLQQCILFIAAAAAVGAAAAAAREATAAVTSCWVVAAIWLTAPRLAKVWPAAEPAMQSQHEYNPSTGLLPQELLCQLAAVQACKKCSSTSSEAQHRHLAICWAEPARLVKYCPSVFLTFTLWACSSADPLDSHYCICILIT